jgi:para-nitrobenzyl esterase
LGITHDRLRALRDEPTEKLMQASGGLTAWAIVDGWVMPQDVRTIYALGEQNDVTTIEGNNADEGTIYLLGSEKIAKTTATGYIAEVKLRYGDLAGQFLDAYPAATDAQAVASTYASFRDERFGWEMRTWARMQTKTGHKSVYRYYFGHPPPGRAGEQLGAFHTSEIAYVFGNSSMYLSPWGDTDRKLSETMMSYWTNFAKTGDPNGAGLPDWPAYDPVEDDVLAFADSVKVRTHINQAGIDFFEAYHASLPAAQSVPTGTAHDEQ